MTKLIADEALVNLKANNQVRKFMAKYRYQYHQTMLNDLVILIAQEANKAQRQLLTELLEHVQVFHPIEGLENRNIPAIPVSIINHYLTKAEPRLPAGRPEQGEKV